MLLDKQKTHLNYYSFKIVLKIMKIKSEQVPMLPGEVSMPQVHIITHSHVPAGAGGGESQMNLVDPEQLMLIRAGELQNESAE